ncbi:hypothetical protein [Gilvibacter sediminis]|uniref:hypothetical protein n=1 Tax=Gilvibacter sediminis TaxID=379071 RepID=UPI0023509A20|nr:hypothetical protein [Gilvibacter sediminis]MDC7998790.1 hypothetical protein [Gilvibacter sediminis]
MRVFVENQKFDQTWLRVLLISVALISLWPVLSLTDWENVDSSALMTVSISIAITLGMIVYLLVLLRLETRIDEQGISYGFEPLPGKMNHKSWDEIENLYVREYSPIGEYGGWGYRVSFSKSTGRAYNVSGNLGIQIELKNGRRVLVGTRKKEEAEAVINYYTKKDQNEAY